MKLTIYNWFPNSALLTVTNLKEGYAPMKMTIEQHEQATRLLPQVAKYAHRYNHRARDEEFTGVAQIAMCEAIVAYDDTKGMSLDDWVMLSVRNALNKAYSRETKDRAMGLAGGAPTQGAVEASRSSGRHVMRKGTDTDVSGIRDMDASFAAPSERDPDSDLHDLIDILPPRLQQVALARWVNHDTLAKIAYEEELTVDQVRYKLDEARQFAILYTTGGSV